MPVGFFCRSPVPCIHSAIMSRARSLLPGQHTQVVIQMRLSSVPPSNLEMDLQCFPDKRGMGGTRLGAVSSLLKLGFTAAAPGQFRPCPSSPGSTSARGQQWMLREGFRLPRHAAASPDLARRPSRSDLAKTLSIHGAALPADEKQNT